ncbi:MAG TPA: hypothetical protein VK524_30345, partial [Polyangiaceae bacterium]|nr:hypothetical protein [Polyangiaceae bacterium]
CWGVLGVVALLGQAIWRMLPLALEPIRKHQLGGFHIGVYVAWVAFSVYAEGYRAFQLRFSPRVVARALHLAKNPRPLHVLLAPAFCMGLLHATRRRLIVAWVSVIAIVSVVIVVRGVPQPWRGIIDGGVVVALVWGVASILYFLGRVLAGGTFEYPSDVPAAANGAGVEAA